VSTVRPLRVVIPGGSGQVGNILARHFHAKGDSVIVLSRTYHAQSDARSAAAIQSFFFELFGPEANANQEIAARSR